MKTLTNRSFYEIIAEVLEVAKTGAKPTDVIRSVVLSYEQYRHYVDMLCARGLLEQFKNAETGDSIFKTTSRGQSFLKSYGQMASLSGGILVAPKPTPSDVLTL